MYPKISIVTPSYNQGCFLEETILSVINQNYPKLEYIIIDGGSTDNSVDIIKKYKDSIAYWVSEKDLGQTNAINKGLRIARGDILTWLNSDDTLLPGVLFKVSEIFASHPEAGIVYGDCNIVDKNGNLVLKRCCLPFDRKILVYAYNLIAQPASFFHRRVIDSIGALDESLNYSMDYEYWIRALKNDILFFQIPFPIASFRIHNSSKSVDQYKNMMGQHREVLNRYRTSCLKRYPIIDRIVLNILWYLYRIKNVIMRGILRKEWSFCKISQAKSKS